MGNEPNTKETRIVIESKRIPAGIIAGILGVIGFSYVSSIFSLLALILGIVAFFQGGMLNIISGVIGIMLAGISLLISFATIGF